MFMMSERERERIRYEENKSVATGNIFEKIIEVVCERRSLSSKRFPPYSFYSFLTPLIF